MSRRRRVGAILGALVVAGACATVPKETVRPAATPLPPTAAVATAAPTPTPAASPTPTVAPVLSPSPVLSAIPSAPAPPALVDFPPQPAGVPWPTEEWPTAEWPAGVDRAAVDTATDRAFNQGFADRVRAVVVVHRGAIIYERYSPNQADGPNVVMPSYSIAKSVVSAMIGILDRDGLIDIHAPAAVPEWHANPTDPRAAITVEHMLHMSTGMNWTDGEDPGSDMFRMATSSDMGAYAADQQLTYRPGTRFDYNTGMSVLLARIVGEAAGTSAEETRAFLDAELFDRIGLEPLETAFDDVGTWAGGTSADSTARGYAKFGLLYLRGGEWDGEQILPREWVEYTRTPSPANPEYGAHWWLEPARPSVLYAIGVHGQVITVDPVHDLVIVQLSTVGGNLPLMQTEAILQAFEAAPAP